MPILAVPSLLTWLLGRAVRQPRWGTLIGALGLVGVPLIAYHVLGRFTSGRIWVVVITDALVGCPPDAYECPT